MSSEVSELELTAMRRALVLGESVRGRTDPNPAVGAVVLTKDGRVAGEGATAPAGGPHAEVLALREAGAAVKGGTAVVTLEPCNHTGRTPPCSEALIEAGIVGVLYAVDDPNPVAAGGAMRLRDAGIEVVPGVERQREATLGALRPWLHSVEHGRPALSPGSTPRRSTAASPRQICRRSGSPRQPRGLMPTA